MLHGLVLNVASVTWSTLSCDTLVGYTCQTNKLQCQIKLKAPDFSKQTAVTSSALPGTEDTCCPLSLWCLCAAVGIPHSVLCGSFTYTTPQEFIATDPTAQTTTEDIHTEEPPLFWNGSPLTGWWLRGSVNYPSVQKRWLNSGNLRRPTCSWHTFALPVWITAPRSKRISLPSAS